MKRSLIIILLIFTTSIATFSQRVVLESNIPRLEKEAMSRMRGVFKVSKKTEFFATIVFGSSNTDTLGTHYQGTNFDVTQQIGQYINRLEISPIDYEIFVYDKDLKHRYIVNRIYFGSSYGFCTIRRKVRKIVNRLLHHGINNKYPKKYYHLYLGRESDYPIFKFLADKRYDYVYIVREMPFYEYEVLLCFKNGLIDLAYLKDGQWYSTPVCGSDDFSFLRPLLEERMKKLEIIREKVKKEESSR